MTPPKTNQSNSALMQHEEFIEKYPDAPSLVVSSKIFQMTLFQDFIMEQCLGKFSYNFYKVPPRMLFELQTDCTLVSLYVNMLESQ